MYNYRNKVTEELRNYSQSKPVHQREQKIRGPYGLNTDWQSYNPPLYERVRTKDGDWLGILFVLLIITGIIILTLPR